VDDARGARQVPRVNPRQLHAYATRRSEEAADVSVIE
jgi:hypothetical protein